jgi:hypothetical protein
MLVVTNRTCWVQISYKKSFGRIKTVVLNKIILPVRLESKRRVASEKWMDNFMITTPIACIGTRDQVAKKFAHNPLSSQLSSRPFNFQQAKPVNGV